jgi:hypothetical protein
VPPWALLDEKRLAAGIVHLPFAENEEDLEWEGDVAIEILVETVVAAHLVA